MAAAGGGREGPAPHREGHGSADAKGISANPWAGGARHAEETTVE